MDPASIIGLTSAVISFVGFVGKVVSTARELSDAGKVDEYERLSELTAALEPGLDKLRNYGQLSEEERSAVRVAEQCKQVSDSIQRLVGKARHPQSKDSSTDMEQISAADKLLDKVIRSAKTGKVALFVLWKKQEAEDLRKQFDSCTLQLNVHLTRLASSDIVAKLDILLTKQLPRLTKDTGLLQTKLGQIAQDQGLLSKSLETFHKKLEGTSAEFLSQLAEVKKTFEATDMTLCAINHRRILNSVRFKEISVRYDQVSRAEKDTFGWLVERSSVPAHYNLKISFREWLSTGRGVFHFLGKPGSGKSVLMKYLSKHPETATQLDIWREDKKLITANTFLWKAGSEKQRSMEGIIRSLLYTILDGHREEFIPKLFPQHWNPANWSPWMPLDDMDVQLTSDEIQQAFETIIGDQTSGYRFCFFIDGADEFEDAEIRKRELASTLLRWTSNNPENLKICVSSREEPAFIDLFPVGQRIRLHLVTANDMRKAIETSLGKHDNFLNFPVSEREEFIDEFVHASEGVFIWTKLVLDELWNKLDDKQPLDELQKVLEVVPRDLDEFYERILLSIRSSDTAESQAIFEIMVTARAEWADPGCLLVQDYSYVKDFITLGSNTAYESSASLKVPGSDRKLRARYRARIQAFKNRLQSLFRGMVEVTTTLSHVFEKEYRFEESLSFTHRSAYDFLLRRQGKDYHPSIDVKAAVLYCLMSRVRYAWGLTGWRTSVFQMVSTLLSILPWIYATISSEERIACFKSLADIDDILMRQQLDQVTTGHIQFAVKVEYSSIQYPLPLELSTLVVSVFNVACWLELYDYVDWVITQPGSWVSKGSARVPLLECLCWIEQYYRRDGALVPFIQLLLRDGPYANVLDEDQSPWGTCLTLAIMTLGIFESDKNPSWEVISVFLQNGSNPDVLFWWDNFDKVGFNETFQLSVSFAIGGWTYSLVHRSVHFGGCLDLPQRIQRALSPRMERGASLRDLYLRFGPQDNPEVLQIIDKGLYGSDANENEMPRVEGAPRVNEILKTSKSTEVSEYLENLHQSLRKWWMQLLSFIIGIISLAFIYFRIPSLINERVFEEVDSSH